MKIKVLILKRKIITVESSALISIQVRQARADSVVGRAEKPHPGEGNKALFAIAAHSERENKIHILLKLSKEPF